MVDRIIFFDMDGVLADFDGHYTAITGTSWEARQHEDSDTKWSHIIAHPTFFLDLPVMPGTELMLDFVMAMPHPFELGICSAASRRVPQSGPQKLQWLERDIRWIPEKNKIIVPDAKLKQQYAGPGNILVDDYEVNIDQWRAAGGIGILYEDAAQTIRELNQIFAEFNPCYLETMRRFVGRP